MFNNRPSHDWEDFEDEESNMSSAKEALAAAKSAAKEQAIEVADAPKSKFYAMLESLGNFDWEKLPASTRVTLLTYKPIRGRRGQPDQYMSPEQALFYDSRCTQLGVSSLGNDAWFDPNSWSTNLTTEGHRTSARAKGLVLSPPDFERKERPWPLHKDRPPAFTAYVQVDDPKKPGSKTSEEKKIETDIGYTCKIESLVHGKWFPCCYTAWLSEWYRPTDRWNGETEHMLQVRACDKAMEMAGVSGISSPQQEPLESDEPARPVEREAPTAFIESPLPYKDLPSESP